MVRAILIVMCNFSDSEWARCILWIGAADTLFLLLWIHSEEGLQEFQDFSQDGRGDGHGG